MTNQCRFEHARKTIMSAKKIEWLFYFLWLTVREEFIKILNLTSFQLSKLLQFWSVWKDSRFWPVTRWIYYQPMIESRKKETTSTELGISDTILFFPLSFHDSHFLTRVRSIRSQVEISFLCNDPYHFPQKVALFAQLPLGELLTFAVQ